MFREQILNADKIELNSKHWYVTKGNNIFTINAVNYAVVTTKQIKPIGVSTIYFNEPEKNVHASIPLEDQEELAKRFAKRIYLDSMRDISELKRLKGAK